jgi:sugar phosphate isomerase/epimerase
MNQYPVAISLGAFGADLVREQGQASFIPLLGEAGVTRIEVREELLVDEDLYAMAEQIAAQGLQCLYSAPLELWLQGQTQVNPELEPTLNRAIACGAAWLKVSLGYFSERCDIAQLAEHLARHDVRLLVENDQTAQGGRIEPLVAFFSAVQGLKLPIGMTFDIGNWLWQEQSVMGAAQQLGRYVEYVHCKAVRRNPAGKLIALPPEPADLQLWERLFEHFAQGLPRAVEYPLQGDDLLGVTREQVALLAGLDHQQPVHSAGEASHV